MSTESKNLVKVMVITNCPCCGKSDNVRKDYDYPKTLRLCDTCGCDFDTDKQTIFNTKESVCCNKESGRQNIIGYNCSTLK